MPSTPALRLRHEHDIPVSLDGVDLATGFTLEAWVKLAPEDGSARLYPNPSYDGVPVRLKPEAYDSLPADRLRTLGSVDLPEGIEAVFFSEPAFRGEAWAVRDDQPTGPDYMTARSVVLIDRRHRRQNVVVLFENEAFRGSARELRLPQTWYPGPSGGLASLNSAWVPPGVALDLEVVTDSELADHTGPKPAVRVVTLRGDVRRLPDGIHAGSIWSVSARRSVPLSGDTLEDALDDSQPLTTTGFQSHPTDAPPLSSFRAPENTAVFFFEHEGFEGRCEVLSEVTAVPWAPGSWAFVRAPDGTDGVLALPDTGEGRVYGPRSTPAGFKGYLRIPAGFRVLHGPDSTRVLGPGVHNIDLTGSMIVERFLGVLTSDGVGLSLERPPRTLKSGPDPLTFGGSPLRTDRWHHIALSGDGTTLRWVLDGREVRTANASALAGLSNWRIGHGLRGTLAGVRVWDRARSTDTIRDGRYLSDPSPDGTLPARDFFSHGPSRFETSPDASVVDANLPTSPAASVVTTTMLRSVQADHNRDMQAAHAAATARTRRARDLARAQVATARTEARRHVHFSAIESICFIRGNDLVKAEWDDVSQTFQATADSARGVLTDLAQAVGVGADGTVLYAAAAWPTRSVSCLTTNAWSAFLTASPVALACHPDGEDDVAIYWIEEDGTFRRSRNHNVTAPEPTLHADGTLTVVGIPLEVVDTRRDPASTLTPVPLPSGRPRTWDLAADPERQRLVWSNGWEVFAGMLDGESLTHVEILVPHVLSPFPVAVAIAPDGTVVWLDAEDGMVRVLRPGQSIPHDLHPAPRASRGLALGLVGGEPDGGEGEAPYVYWVSAERRTLHLPVLDAPGQYLDLRYDPTTDILQHVDAVGVLSSNGAEWSLTPSDLPFSDRQPIQYGPFDAKRGIRIRMTYRVDHPIGNNYGLLSISDHMKDVDAPQMTIRGDQLSTAPTRIVINSVNSVSFPHPLNELCELDVVLHPSAPEPIRILLNGSRIETTGLELNEYLADLGETLFVSAPVPHHGWMGGVDDGLLSSIEITDLADSPAVLVCHTADLRTGPITPLSEGSSDLQANNPGAHRLHVSQPDGVVVFEPVLIDLKSGWTGIAQAVTCAPSEHPTCIYELATAEDEDRIVCVVEPDGLPSFRIRWGGQTIAGTRRLMSGTRLKRGDRADVAWVLSPMGLATTYVGGEAVLHEEFDIPFGPRAFEGHRFGSPAPPQAHTGVRSMRAQDDDSITTITPFSGSMSGFSAWVGYVPAAVPTSASSGKTADGLPGLNPSWRHESRPVETHERYLHVARLDGTEPPLSLFPIDLDGGLTLETELSIAHGELSIAHAKKVAADAHADAAKKAALDAARATLSAATRELADARRQADQKVADASAEATRTRKNADVQKKHAVLDATEKQADAMAQAAQTRASGTRDAEATEARAAASKSAQVSAANRRRDQKRTERDAKRRDYESKR